MEAYNTPIYPVFEADQVLSQKELNLVVSHLEEQDRITRKNLIGLGIVCGLDLSFLIDNTVKISCGTAVTSLGFQMNWSETILTHYQDFDMPDTFLKPDYTREPHLDFIFKYVSQYESIKNCIELLPSSSAVPAKKPIPKDFFINKAIILFLEVSLIDQKNCNTTNCDDKGKRMEFIIRPLVIPINELTKSLLPEQHLEDNYSKLTFPRYNVPHKNLITGISVLDEFKKVFEVTQLLTISNAIKDLYTDHKYILPNESSFTIFENSKAKMDEMLNIHKSNVGVQYLWDWISDITLAYNEIIEFKKINPSFCCVNESLFPFHVVLGTNATNSSVYRTAFTPSLNATKKEALKLKKIILLFERLASIINSFEMQKVGKIKITPSTYGSDFLSKKAIPFYYNQILDLNQKWNPELTLKTKNDTILSYLSDIPNYSNKIEVQKPLLFEMEPYNFFRIEGHIGMNYKKAIKDLTLIKDSYSLPFKITALNAVDFLNKEVDILKFDGRWDDLETDYDLARKRIYNITEFVIKWMDVRRDALEQNKVITKQNIDNFKNILAQLKNLLTNDLKEFLPNYKSFYEIFKQLNYVFLFHRWCIQLFNTTLSTLAEDLIDRMDDINELFLDDPFTVIYEEANLRWQKTYKDLFFSTYIKKHPGLEHKAGVTKGGTFVLVYVDSSIFKAAAPPLLYTNLLTAVTSYRNSINIADSVKQELIDSVKFTDYKSQIKTKPIIGDKCKAETDNIKANLLEVAKYNMDENYTLEMSGFILENIKNALQYEIIPISKGNTFQQLIIADFFLPYACCGDGNTIEVKIEVNEPLFISLDILKYCNNDSDEYEIKIKGKSGGKFSGTAKNAVIQKSDKYYLVPNLLAIKVSQSHTLQYELDEEFSNTINFEILASSTLKWTAERDKKDPNQFQFINPIPNDTHEYQFDFGDDAEITTKESTVSHIFKFNEKVQLFTVSIKQLGEVCENNQTIIVKMIGDFRATDFNEKDFNTNK
ncbi:hypothetical protein CLU83_3718 [Flavobacterium sp. 1]|uniref:hypothetical protein n=1 Tax=Flavobacterium sp. 1 TaxID=2035200 RepID=UPI000C23811F|nr:hypothetical protein [Flavobacterium sp. 1]PJJ10315.1 hypothetical protein CLU83_3718 [Flavobacterium sp. 1]